jgi:hypothetical protein
VYLIEKFLFKERREALRVRFWRVLLRYRTSYPYLSGDAFAELCDYAAYGKDGSKQLNVRKLRRANKLFVPSHRLHELLQNHFDDISATTLICGNSDENFTSDPQLPTSVKLWLCQNYAVENGIGRVLPIGLENLRLGKSGFKRFFELPSTKSITQIVLVPPMRVTNPIRSQVAEICKEYPTRFQVIEKYLSTSDYFKLLAGYKYVLVLEGNGFDTHRLWECLYLDCLPIVIETPWSLKIIRELNLPVLTVSSVNSLQSVDLEQLLSAQMPRIHESTTKFLSISTWKTYLDSI